MSGNLIGGIVGGVIGFVAGGPMGAVRGFMLGSAIGGVVAPGELPTIEGPRLTDLRVQASEYGRPIPIVFGTVALQGNVIWAADIKEVRSETEEGGKGGPSQTTVNYSYFGSFAIALCDGPIEGVGRIWAGPEKRLIYDGTSIEGGIIRIYTGDELQLPDPLIEQYEGAGNVPAYRGTAYIVFEDFPLARDGNRLPFITVEVGASANSCPIPVQQPSGLYMSDPAPEYIAEQPDSVHLFHDSTTGFLYWTRKMGDGTWFLDRRNLETGESGPALLIASSGTVRIAWNGAGVAQYIVYREPAYTPVNLVDWVVGSKVTITEDYIEADGSVTTMEIGLADVVYKGDGTFGHLSYSNSVNTFGESSGAYGIHPVPSEYTWGSTGSRVGGHLTPMGIFGAAASFDLQPSNYSDVATNWDLWIGGNHNILFSFDDGAYYDQETGFVAMSAPSFGTVQHAVYDESRDMVYVWQNSAGLVAYDPKKLTSTSWPREDCIYYNTGYPQSYGDGVTPIEVGTYAHLAVMEDGYIGITTYPGGHIFKMKLRGSVKANGALLGDIVADLSERAGMSSYDVGQLTDEVDGYAIAKQTEIRSAIDALRPAYFFDAVESQGVVKFVKRGGAVAATIPDEDLAAHMPGDEPGEPLSTVRKQEVELPREVSVGYMLAANEYEPAVKTSKRLTGSSHDTATYEMPLVLSDTKAQQVADVVLHSEWAGRLSYQFATSRKYAHLEPTDLVVVKGHLMRIVKVSATPGGLMKFEAISDDTHYYQPHVVVTETPPVVKEVMQPQATTMELM